MSAARGHGPKALRGSAAARKAAMVILETLSGSLGPKEASEALGTSLTRYYVLETRALEGLIEALEPRPKGRQKGPAERLAEAEKEIARLRREVRRHQALLRAAHRGLGLSALSPRSGKVAKQAGRKKVRRRGKGRGAKVLRTLAAEPGETSP